MAYDPEKHHRRSIRLKDHDYSQNGAYFVTLCSFGRECCFTQFPELAAIVDEEWRRIPERFPNAFIDDYVVMPNHFHGIIVIENGIGNQPDGGPKSGYPKSGYPQGVSLRRRVITDRVNLGNIIGAFKSLSVNAWLKVIKSRNINARGKFWQDNYYEHVIRNEKELNLIRTYISDNPMQWESDRENPVNHSCTDMKQYKEWMV